jgi:hypothetical protein
MKTGKKKNDKNDHIINFNKKLMTEIQKNDNIK